jgi:8-oxo-dGTP diphosphatase
MPIKRIEVAVGIVWNDIQQVLVGQRTVEDNYFGKWEFPGGKLEAGESSEQALKRELQEELGIKLFQTELLMTLEHDYPDRHVRLHVHTVREFSGKATGMEGQAIKWVFPKNLAELDFLAGNQVIVEALVSPK